MRVEWNRGLLSVAGNLEKNELSLSTVSRFKDRALR
jgi:hypothetical protein